MADAVLCDNDVILKTCCYDTVDDVLDVIAGQTRTVLVLGAVRFVLSKAIGRARNIADKQRATDCLARFLSRVALIEPNDDELLLAVEFEEAAQSCGVDLDGGESQLLAVLINRSAALLITGDKRAVRAVEPVVKSRGYEEHVARRVACLEQVTMALVGRLGAETLHVRICREANVDISLAICFSCATGLYRQESVARALLSYIGDLRRHAPSVLVDSDDLSTVIP